MPPPHAQRPSGHPLQTAAAERRQRPAGRPAGPIRSLAWWFAAAQGVLGTWAYLAPARFYAGFPLPGLGWISNLGPYDEHLTRDLGTAWIALGVVTMWMARRAAVRDLAATMGGFVLAGLLHGAYHLTALRPFTAASAAAQLVSLAALVIAPATIAALLWRTERARVDPPRTAESPARRAGRSTASSCRPTTVRTRQHQPPDGQPLPIREPSGTDTVLSRARTGP